MKIDAIIGLIRSIARTSEFYDKIYHNLIYVRDNYPNTWVNIVNELESQNFPDDKSVFIYFRR